MISPSSSCARRRATAVLPTAVGPVTMTTRGMPLALAASQDCCWCWERLPGCAVILPTAAPGQRESRASVRLTAHAGLVLHAAHPNLHGIKHVALWNTGPIACIPCACSGRQHELRPESPARVQHALKFHIHMRVPLQLDMLYDRFFWSRSAMTATLVPVWRRRGAGRRACCDMSW